MKLLLLIVSIFTSVFSSKYDTASFFGDSFISLPLEEASSSTILKMRMKTSRQDALLFLAAGDTDYCLVSLVGGRVSVRINLGSGETELISPSRFFVHDLVWHEILVLRNNSILTLTVDNTHTTSVKLSGRFHELNIHHGIFVGGLGSFDQLFLGLLDPFRGCMSNVRYNEHNIFVESALTPSTPQKQTAEIFAVEWTCSDQFLGTASSQISLLHGSSYLSFKETLPRKGGTLKLFVKTQVEEGILVYATGPPSRSDFISLEIKNKFLLLTIDDGDGANAINSSHAISDGYWHSVEILFSPSLMVLTTDDSKKEWPLAVSQKKYLDLSGFLYFGGMEVNRRARAIQQGVTTAEKSVRGCLKLISVNGVKKGLQNSMVTKGISKGCQFEYPCLRSPCITDASCTHVGTNEFRCTCQESLCVRQDFLPTSFSTQQTRLPNTEILKVYPVAVEEGEQKTITASNIVLTLDYGKLGVLKSRVLFHMLKNPTYGEVVITDEKPKVTTRNNFLSELNTRMGLNFSLLDLEQGRVSYKHDGSESTSDSVTFSMELMSQKGYMLPSYFQTQLQVVLPVTIHATNDPPELELPSGPTLRMAKGSVVKLTPNIIKAVDADSPPEKLVFSVINHKDGYIKKSNSSKPYTLSFTQEDITNGLISYVNTGQDQRELIMKVSDGEKVSVPTVLEVETYALDIFLVNNTGLNIVHGTSVVILPDNLSCSSNEGEEETDIMYVITLNPRYGRIEQLRENGQWEHVKEFTENQIQQLRVRYFHIRGTPKLDKFYFRLSAMAKIWPEEYIFRINYQTVSVEVVRNAELLINGIQESFISEGYLYTVTHPTPNARSEIKYTLLTVPKFGEVYLSTSDLIYQAKLDVYSNFTQDDITKGRLKYKLNYSTFSNFQDSFQFLVTCMGHESRRKNFNIIYESLPFEGKIISETVILKEGERQFLNSSNLNIIGRGFSRITYNLKQKPQHGMINVIDHQTRKVIRYNTSHFSNMELNLGLIFYKHDDSENFKDVVKFVAITEDGRPNFQVVSLLKFEIIPQNDNAPAKLFDRVLNIVSKSERIVSASDISFYDPDIESTSSQLRFVNIKQSSGQFFKENQETESFTQQDIKYHSIKLKHYGDSYSKASVTVSDGHLFVTDYIEIVASEPYIEIINNTGLIAPMNARTVMNYWNLSATTNVDIWNYEITYKILQHPKYGKLRILGKKDDAIESFTQTTLDLGSIFYEHNGSSESNQDFFKFKVQVQNVFTEGIVLIEVYPECYWDEILPLHNRSFTVEEDTTEIITTDNLNFYHPEIPQKDILYTIVKPPSHGSVMIRTKGGKLNKVLQFSQLQVSAGNVFFRGVGKRNLSSDYFHYRVSNGVTQTPVNTFLVQVTPGRPVVFGGSFRVLEGNTITIPAAIINKILSPTLHSLAQDSGGSEDTDRYKSTISNTISDSDVVERFEVLKHPTHGVLKLKSQIVSDELYDYFTREQLQKNELVYSHNGSEDREDEFLIVRTVTSKGASEEDSLQHHKSGQHSSPVKVSVIITNKNDEKPEVFRNEGIVLWEDDNIILTGKMLEVKDNDTSPDDLKFECSDPTNGYLAFRDMPNKPVTTFSQLDISEQKIFFKHSGASEGGFSWRVSDGEHSTGVYVFTVTAKVTSLNVDFTEPFEILPLSKKTISNSHLMAHFNNPEHMETIYLIVKEHPKYGEIISQKGNSIWLNSSTFTQKEVDEEMIAYEQTISLDSLNQNDYFVFDVESPPFKMIKNIRFNISIKLSSSLQMQKLLSLKPINVSEGGFSTFSEANFNLSALEDYIYNKIEAEANSRLKAIIYTLPVHGKLSIAGRSLHVGNSINSQDIRSGNMIYTHDHSDTLIDSVNLRIQIQSTKLGEYERAFNFSIEITISPINDKIFRLEKSSMSVIRFQTRTLSNQDLYTSDEDTPSEEIKYQIISGPISGQIIISNSTSDGLTFTQKDIEDGLVSFSNDGTNQPSKLDFQVSDGGHTPEFGSLDISILPLEIKLINLTNVKILQTTTVLRISNNNLAAETNDNNSVVTYNITDSPKHGDVYIDGMVVQFLNQTQIDDGKLIYLQSDMEAGNDSIEIVAWMKGAVLPPKRIDIIIKPLIRMHPLQAVAGSKMPITLHNLNASDLHRISSYLPLYEIIKPPKFAFLKKITRNKDGSINSYEIKEFSHSDLISNNVYLTVKSIKVPHNHPMTDKIELRLSVMGGMVQPALVTFTIEIHPMDSNILNSIDNPRQLRPDISTTSQSIGESSFLLSIVAIILSIIVTLIITVLAAVVCSRRKLHKDNEKFIEISLPIKDESQEDSLATDHSSVMATYFETPNILIDTSKFDYQVIPSKSSEPQHLEADTPSSDIKSSDISPALLQCKANPLAGDSSLPLQVTQIYKNNESEEWSLSVQNPLTNNSASSPLPLKNQYWL